MDGAAVNLGHKGGVQPFYKEMQEISFCPFTVCLTDRPNYIGFFAFSHKEVVYLFVIVMYLYRLELAMLSVQRDNDDWSSMICYIWCGRPAILVLIHSGS